MSFSVEYKNVFQQEKSIIIIIITEKKLLGTNLKEKRKCKRRGTNKNTKK